MMADRVRKVVRQTRARVLEGITQFPDKLLSLFETHTEVIRKGKAAKPNEFGNVVELQEAENQIITHYEVFEQRYSDQHLLLSAIEAHRRKLGRVPRWVAADAGFYSQANEQEAKALGVRSASIPNRKTRSKQRRRWEKSVGSNRLMCGGRVVKDGSV
jgi:transposase, IS5 family